MEVATSSGARGIVLAGLVALVASSQLWTLLELAGLMLPVSAVLAAQVMIVAAAVVFAIKRPRPPEPKEMDTFWLLGLTVFLVWAALYFATSRFSDPRTARTFSDWILERLPLKPELAPLYVGVHVFGIIPFCVLPEMRLLRRHLLGAILIVGISAILWVVLPVRLDRPTIPPDLPGFGAWIMRTIHSFDPTTNCFPSVHCAIAVYAATGLRFGRSRPLFVWGIASAALVCVSTVLTKQHYVVDALSGIVLAAICAYLTQRKTRRAPFDG